MFSYEYEIYNRKMIQTNNSLKKLNNYFGVFIQLYLSLFRKGIHTEDDKQMPHATSDR